MMVFSSAKMSLYPTPLQILTHHLPINFSIHLPIYHPLIDPISSGHRRCFNVRTFTTPVSDIVSEQYQRGWQYSKAETRDE